MDWYYPIPEICKYLGISRDAASRWMETEKHARTYDQEELEIQDFRNR